MGIEYSPADNKITVTGYSALTPCNFTGLWTEDKAGTLELMPATLPAMNMTLTTQIKPSDEVALKIDFILASSGAGAGDTIVVTGLDKNSSAQSETIDVSGGDATYTSTKWFKTITDIDCNGFSSGTLTVRQNQWGVVWKLSANEFRFVCLTQIGDGSTATWFVDTQKTVVFDLGWITSSNKIAVEIKRYGNFILGELYDLDTKQTEKGCSLTFLFDFSSDYWGYGIKHYIWSYGNGKCYLYSTSILGKGNDVINEFRSVSGGDTGRVWNCGFYDKAHIGYTNYYNIYNFQQSGGGYGIRRPFPTSEINYITAQKVVAGVYFQSTPQGIVKNLNALATGYEVQVYGISNDWVKVIDANMHRDDWRILFSGSAVNTTIYRQYTFNLKVIDKDGNPITTAKVKADYKTGVCFAQEDVNASGNLVADKTITKGFYNQTNGNNLVYQEAGFDYEYIDLEVKAVGYATHKERFSIEGKMSETDTNIVKLDPGTTMDLSGNLFKKITPSSMVRL